MKTLISIDPGQSSGLICGTYSDDKPFELTHAFQIEGGVEGFVRDVSWETYYDSAPELFVAREPGGDQYGTVLDSDREVIVLVEKFNARGSANAGFSYTSKSLEPLRVEGAILALGIKPIWVSPPQQYFLPGSSKAEKKKRQHAWLKENGYYVAPKDVGCSDADDARSALAHCISYLRRQKHKPTLELFRKDEGD